MEIWFIDNLQNFRNIKILDITRYGLSAADDVDLGLLYGYNGIQSVKNLVDELERIYCGAISYEFSYLEVKYYIIYTNIQNLLTNILTKISLASYNK